MNTHRESYTHTSLRRPYSAQSQHTEAADCCSAAVSVVLRFKCKTPSICFCRAVMRHKCNTTSTCFALAGFLCVSPDVDLNEPAVVTQWLPSVSRNNRTSATLWEIQHSRVCVTLRIKWWRKQNDGPGGSDDFEEVLPPGKEKNHVSQMFTSASYKRQAVGASARNTQWFRGS